MGVRILLVQLGSSLGIPTGRMRRCVGGFMQYLAVYCGSRNGRDPVFTAAAEAVGEALVQHGAGLVYGGAQIGLMGVVADAVLSRGGQVIGVIPEALVADEVVHAGLSRLEVVQTMHERKARMLELADGMVALPGGFGTLEELFEALSWLQMRLHEQPCGLLNVGGFFDALLEHLDASVQQGFLNQHHRDLLRQDTDADRLVRDLLEHN